MTHCALQPCDQNGIVAFPGEQQRYCLHHAYERRQALGQPEAYRRFRAYLKFADRTARAAALDTSHLFLAV